MIYDSMVSRWMPAIVLLARLLLLLVFLMAFVSKLMMFDMTASSIAVAGFPLPYLLTCLAALFEFALVASLLLGICFSEMMLLGAAYVIFLAFAFHGPSHWTDAKQLEMGAFISHFPFAAGLLFAAANGPGRLLILKGGLSQHSHRQAK